MLSHARLFPCGVFIRSGDCGQPGSRGCVQRKTCCPGCRSGLFYKRVIMMNKRTAFNRSVPLLLLCFMIAASLSGCGSGAQPGADNNNVPSSQPSAQPTASPAASDPATLPPLVYEMGSLAVTYSDYFLIGTVYNPYSTQGADKELLLKDFNAITPENLMKPQYMQPTEGEFNFEDSDAMMQFALDNGLKVTGHTLVWHQQTGDWLGRNVTRDEAIEQLRNHITTIVGRYKGKVTSWDVVNEAVNDSMPLPPDGNWKRCLRNTQWLQSIGPDYIAMAFNFAHEADPDAILYYNDYNLNLKDKAQIVHAMVKDLKEQGVPIHGIGMQGHYSTIMQIEPVDASLELFSTLDVEVSITELDVTVGGAPATGLSQEDEVTQALMYARLFKIFRKHMDIIARVTFWGTLDSTSWRSKQYPCLFNSDYSPKEAYYAVLDPERYLKEHAPVAKDEGNRIRAPKGTPVIDGEIDEVWSLSAERDVNKQVTAWEGATGKLRMLWDENFVYALFEVRDGDLSKRSANCHEQDSIEIFLDQRNDKIPSYGPDDGQYRVNFDGEESFGMIPETPGFKSAAKRTADGYIVELAIPLIKQAMPGTVMGFEAQINDSNSEGVLQGVARLYDTSGNPATSMEKVGLLILVKE